MSWTYEPIGNLYEVHNGLSKPAKFFGRGFPFAAFKDVFNNVFLPSELSGLVESDEKEQTSYSLHRGDILITRTSETYDELGMSSVALKDYPGATYNGFTKRLRPLDSRLLPEFIGYYMRSPGFRQNFLQFSQMTTRASLKNENLLSISVPVPPMAEQERIAGTLFCYDALIENNRKQVKLLEEAAQRLYKEWFIDLRFPGHEAAEIDPETGLPKGWQVKRIEQLCTRVQSGSTPSRKNANYWNRKDYDWFKTAELEDHWLIQSAERISRDALEETSVKVFPANSILMAIYASPTLGRLGLMSHSATFNQAALGFVADDSLVSKEWLFQKLFELRPKFNSIARGAGQQNISGEMVKKYKIIVPNISLIQQYTNLARPMFEKMLLIQKQNSRLTEARDRLLPRLMSGELEV